MEEIILRNHYLLKYGKVSPELTHLTRTDVMDEKAVIIVNVRSLDTIEKDPDFGKNLVAAIRKYKPSGDGDVWIGARNPEHSVDVDPWAAAVLYRSSGTPKVTFEVQDGNFALQIATS